MYFLTNEDQNKHYFSDINFGDTDLIRGDNIKQKCFLLPVSFYSSFLLKTFVNEGLQ